MALSSHTIIFLFSFVITFFSFHLQPYLCQTNNQVAQPSANAKPLFNGPDWYYIFIQPYDNEDKPVSSAIPSRNLRPQRSVNEEDAPAASSLTPLAPGPLLTVKVEAEKEGTSVAPPATTPGPDKRVAHETKNNDAPTTGASPSNVLGSSNTGPSAEPVDNWDAWIDILMSKIPGFSSISPLALRTLVSTTLYVLNEYSPVYKEFSQYWNIKQREFPVKTIVPRLKKLNESGYVQHFDFVKEEPLDEVNEDLYIFSQSTGISYWTKDAYKAETQYSTLALQSMIIKDLYQFTYNDKNVLALDKDIKYTFTTLNGEQRKVRFIQGTGRIPSFTSESMKAMVLDLPWQKAPEFKGTNVDVVAGYFIQTTEPQFTMSMFDKVREKLQDTPQGTVNVVFPPFHVKDTVKWSKTSLPKFFGRNNPWASFALGTIHGGVLSHQSGICFNQDGGTSYGISFLEVYNDGTEIQETLPKLSTSRQTLSPQGADSILFDKSFYFVLYKKTSKTILQIAHVTDVSSDTIDCSKV